MHEYSLVQAMFDQIGEVARSRGATAVRRVRLRIGELAGVDPDLLRTAYDVFRVRTLCEDAPLEISRVPPHWMCPAGHGEMAAGGPLRCGACGRPARLETGDEIVLDQLELEVP